MSLLAALMPAYDIPRPSQEAVLRLECWYHGLLTRIRSECLVRSEGDFLVRDSISSKGDFVLTVFWNGRAVHFQINKDPATTSSSGFLFQFEEEQFENVPDLITFYQTHRKPITQNSGCIISNPVPKTTIFSKETEPRQEIEQNYMKILKPQLLKCGQERPLSQQVLLSETRKQLQLRTTAESSPPNSPLLPNGTRHLSLSALLSRPLPRPVPSPIKEDDDEYCEMDYDAMEDSAATAVKSAIASTEPDEILDASTSSLNHLTNRKMSVTSLVNSSTFLATSSHALTSTSCQDVSKLHWRLPRTGSAPSLPNRKPTLPTRDSGCVADSADYDQPRTQCAASTSSAIDVHNYQSPHIEPNNRPQTQELIEKFRHLLLTTRADRCAELITAEDCRLLRLGRKWQGVPKNDRLNGLSLILLPHGRSVRNDLIERSRSLHYLCILSVLHQLQADERKSVLEAWIRIASTLYYQYGNAFSFLTLINALRSDILVSVSDAMDAGNPLESELQSVLRPIVEKLEHCDRLPDNCPKISIPFMQPLLDLLSDKPFSNFQDTTNSLSAQIDNLWRWLEEGRNWARQAAELDQYYSKLCPEKVSHGENFLCTEFSLKFLFGSKGYALEAGKRYDKLAAMADVLKERCKLRM